MNAASGLVVELLVREQFQEAAEREQRRSQLVRSIRDELLPRGVEPRELNPHAVERAREITDLVAVVIDDRLVEVPAGDALGGGLEAQEPCSEHPRRSQSEHEGEDERESRRDEQALLDELHGGERVRKRRLEENDRGTVERHGHVRVVAVAMCDTTVLDLAGDECCERHGIGRDVS